jgi:hypothetical protein
MIKALVVRKEGEGKPLAAVEEIAEDMLPEGNVTVAVEYSTVNYKDGLCIGPGGGLVRAYPHVPGIDFAGSVEASDDHRYKPGDKVVLTGWRVGETHWGGYAQKARVDADWLVPGDPQRRCAWPGGSGRERLTPIPIYPKSTCAEVPQGRLIADSGLRRIDVAFYAANLVAIVASTATNRASARALATGSLSRYASRKRSGMRRGRPALRSMEM